MEKQKKIALINDLTGFGRCSTAVMAPIVSAMKIQAVAVPTAILSAHTQFPTYYFDDYTDRMKEYIQTYKDLKLDFDAISTGFLGSEQQVDIVLDLSAISRRTATLSSSIRSWETMESCIGRTRKRCATR